MKKKINIIVLILFFISFIAGLIELSFYIYNNLINYFWLIVNIALLFLPFVIIIIFLIFIKQIYPKIKNHFIKDQRFHSDLCKFLNRKKLKLIFIVLWFMLILINIWLAKLWWDNWKNQIITISFLFENMLFFSCQWVWVKYKCSEKENK
ncbi:hypothetical protein [Mycoplasma sp. 480]|uniref:hypothetical protein n=1 Tax=Mycoplasma sp. 480 TaxID=3440155 RepID=UPI003F519688